MAGTPDRPNILWLTCEDIGPHLGCFGDSYSTSPNLDALAARGCCYRTCWSNAPVCAPARTTIITGVYACSTGSEHMRSMQPQPAGIAMFPELLRASGYYCSNNSKEDYNLTQPRQVWDDSSTAGHWRNRGEGQPFFAVFNNVRTHESQIRTRPHEARHDPAKVRVPAYHPDTPEVRQDWAQYYDIITEMDVWTGDLLAQLEADGLAEDTIVFFYGDHGSGMPRHKRACQDSGPHCPLIVHLPEKWRHLASDDFEAGGSTERLVSFVDLAPTVLSLANITPPDWMQGRAFLGDFEDPERDYLFSFRGRMDERYDLVRGARDQRYVYVRNFNPHLPLGQHVDYMFQTPTTQIWHELWRQGKTTPAQSAFWEPRAPEELYDLEADPDETVNLATSPEHEATLSRLREAVRRWQFEVRDPDLLPEPELHSLPGGATPYDYGHDRTAYPLPELLSLAELASGLAEEGLPVLREALFSPEEAFRYWGALGLLMRGQSAVEQYAAELREKLSDPAASVRVVAAEALSTWGSEHDLPHALGVLGEVANPDHAGPWAALMALNSLDRLEDRAAGAKNALAALGTQEDCLKTRELYPIATLVARLHQKFGLVETN